MASPVNGPASARPYSSSVRNEGARLTRQAITEAATTLFVRDGYAATSLAAVAREAGCARPTVFATFGSKAALLRQVLDVALAGDDEPIAVAERPWFRGVWTADSLDALSAAYADVCLLIGSRAADVFEAVRRAVDADPEIRELWQELVGNRRAGAQMVVEQAMRLPGARPRREKQSAVDLVWFANDPAHYTALVQGCGWSRPRVHRWLTAQFSVALKPTVSGP